MSRNILRCPTCKRPLLHTRRNGRVKVMGDIESEPVANGIKLHCLCGAKRSYTAINGGTMTAIPSLSEAGLGRFPD